jgi:hypothetical protein
MVKNIVIDSSAVNKVVNGLKGIEKQAPAAFTSALNRTLDHVYTKTGRVVKQNYNVSVNEIKSSMTKYKASYSRHRAWIQVRSRRFTLARFLPGGVGSTSKMARVKIKKSAGRVQVGGSPPAFVQRAPNGLTHIFRRAGKKRYPIDVLRSLSPTQMVENLDVSKEIQADAIKKLEERIVHEIDYRLKKVKGK